jgi:hypothetical protein
MGQLQSESEYAQDAQIGQAVVWCVGLCDPWRDFGSL